MQIIWRTLPRLALPAAVGLGAAYLLTSFVPRPAPTLRPPEALRAGGLGYAEESPVRAILEKNVLNLESTPFAPLGMSLLSNPAFEPPPAPEPSKNKPPVFAAQPQAPAGPPQAGFAPLEPALTPQAGVSASAPLSGGSQVQGQTVSPAAPSGSPSGTQEKAASAPAAAAAPQNGQAKPAPAAPAVSGQPKAAPASQAVGIGIEGFRLVGVIAGGEKPLAMLQVDGAAASLRPGEQARGWTLMTVEPGQVLFRRGQELRRVVLGGRQP